MLSTTSIGALRGMKWMGRTVKTKIEYVSSETLIQANIIELKEEIYTSRVLFIDVL